MNGSWSFGWTQALTIVGYILTIVIALAGFRTFGRWKREKIEEKRIEAAIDALAIMHEASFIFSNIRGSFSFDQEWSSMPEFAGDTEENGKRRQRGPFFAVLKRIDANREFFERAWKAQIRCSAIFGRSVEQSFLQLQTARRQVQVAAEMLVRDPYPTIANEDNTKIWEDLRADVWEGLNRARKRPDPVGVMLDKFRNEVERLCRPIVEEGFRSRRIWFSCAKSPSGTPVGERRYDQQL